MKCGELPAEFSDRRYVLDASSRIETIRRARAGLGDYEPEPLPVDGMMVHAIERLFGVVCQT
jgi:hypothetical protein